MALRGTLRDFSLGEILQLIGYQRKTGILTVEGRHERFWSLSWRVKWSPRTR